MPGLTPELLNEQALRSYAGNNSYNKGVAYYWQKRVELIYLEDDHAHLHVMGTMEYCVDISLEMGQFDTEFTCPYGDSGYFCKHIVAAGLYLRDYLRLNGSSMWKGTVETALRIAQQPSGRSRTAPYLLFLVCNRILGTGHSAR